MFKAVWLRDTLLGMVIPTRNVDGSPLCLITIEDRWGGDTLDEGILATQREAEGSMDTIRRINRALHRYPVCTVPPIDMKGVIVFRNSQRWGAAQVWVSVKREGEYPDMFGAVYPLLDGTWINQYRPQAFRTKEEAAYDLLSFTNPTQYEITR